MSGRPASRSRRTAVASVAIAAALAAGWWVNERLRPVSELGVYRGYTSPVYDGWVRESRYLVVRDGTRLAADLYRPTRDGVAVEEPLPVLWTHERYHRADRRDGKLRSSVAGRAGLQRIVRHGYVLAIVDVRGGGASFGSREGPFSAVEGRDGYDITEWFAAQPWCSGRVGMFGRSYGGITQFLTAALAPPHLTAIFPEMAMFDLYDFVYPGGVFRADFVEHWSRAVVDWDSEPGVVPVDRDRNGRELARAMAEHARNRAPLDVFAPLRHRDSRIAGTGEEAYRVRSPASFIEAIERAGVAVYQLAGWWDMFPRDALLWHANLDVPRRLVIGPWSHGDTRDFSRSDEQLRWFDYWLKEVANGVMDEDPIAYYTMGAAPERRWRSTASWPPPGSEPVGMWFCEQHAPSVASSNDAGLCPTPPVADDAEDADDRLVVDYEATSGSATRWSNGYGGPFGYGDMTANDERGLTYTTAPLAADTEITGHPVVHLWLQSDAPDVDAVVYLEDVGDDGRSHYVTEGVLRASLRALADPPFEYLGLPYHRGYAEDAQPLTGEWVQLDFDLYPTSYVVQAGHRLRVTIAGADRGNLEVGDAVPPPSFRIARSGERASRITLPIMTAGELAAAAAR